MPAADVVLAQGREPGDAPARQGGAARLRHGPDRPPQPDRHPRVGRRRRAAGRVHPAPVHPARAGSRNSSTWPCSAGPTSTRRRPRSPGPRPRSAWPAATGSPPRSSAPSTRWTRRASSTSGSSTSRRSRSGTAAGPWSASARPSTTGPTSPCEQAQQRAVAQVRSALAKWNGASELIKETGGLTAELAREVGNLERLFDQGQTDLGRLMQAQQRLIQLENRGGRRHLGGHPGPGRPAAGPGCPGLDPGDAQSGREAAGGPPRPPPRPRPRLRLSPSPFRAADDRTSPPPRSTDHA